MKYFLSLLKFRKQQKSLFYDGRMMELLLIFPMRWRCHSLKSLRLLIHDAKKQCTLVIILNSRHSIGLCVIMKILKMMKIECPYFYYRKLQLFIRRAPFTKIFRISHGTILSSNHPNSRYIMGVILDGCRLGSRKNYIGCYNIAYRVKQIFW